MFQDHPVAPPIRVANSLVLRVQLERSLSSRRRRAFFRLLHRRVREIGLLVSEKHGLCVFYGAEQHCRVTHWHQLVYWLIDQRQVAAVDAGELGHLADIFAPDAVDGEPYVDGVLLRRVAWGVVHQWARYLAGALK